MLPKIPNPLDSLDTRTWWTPQGIANLATFLIGTFLLGLAILMGLIFVVELFWGDEAVESPWPSLIVIILTTLVGLVICQINKQKYNNLLLQKVVTIYTWLCAGFTLVIYLRVILRAYQYRYPYPDKLQLYTIALLMPSLAVIVLPILRDRYYVRRFSLPILFGSLIHLLMITHHYVFSDVFSRQMEEQAIIQNLEKFDITIYHYFAADIFLFLMMLMIALWMLSNPRLMINIKNRFDNSFRPAE